MWLPRGAGEGVVGMRLKDLGIFPVSKLTTIRSQLMMRINGTKQRDSSRRNMQGFTMACNNMSELNGKDQKESVTQCSSVRTGLLAIVN